MKGYKTVLFNVGAALIPLGDALVSATSQIEGNPEVKSLIPEGWLPYYALIVALANIWLRTRTDTPVFKQTPDPTAAVVVMKVGEPPAVESVSVVVEKGAAPPSTETLISAASDAAGADVGRTKNEQA